MTPAPVHYVLIPFPACPGDRGVWRRAKPSYPRSTKSQRPPWPLKQEIPDAHRRAMIEQAKRTAQEGREREQLRAALAL
jgi:hypothetical protein